MPSAPSMAFHVCGTLTASPSQVQPGPLSKIVLRGAAHASAGTAASIVSNCIFLFMANYSFSSGWAM